MWGVTESGFLKANYLSLGGCKILIKSTLSNLLFYFLFLFKIPKELAAELQKQCLWKEKEIKKLNLINWQIVSLSKKEGGLCSGDIIHKSTVFLGKWLWCFPREQDSLGFH